MLKNKAHKSEEITIENLSIKTRNNPELMTVGVTHLMTLFGSLKLDCGCIAKSPGFPITIIELENGVYIAVCEKCEKDVYSNGNYIGSLPTKISC